MKKLVFTAVAGMLLVACSHDEGHVTINVPKDYSENTVVVSHVIIDDALKATSADDVVVVYDTLEVKNGVAAMKLDPKGAAYYSIYGPVLGFSQPEFYASPNDVLEITVDSFEPCVYTAKGTELMEDISRLLSITIPIRQESVEYMDEHEDISPDEAKAMIDKYDQAIKQFVADNPKSPAVAYAILDLSGDDFKAIYDNMTPEARKSIIMPYADAYNRDVEEMVQEREAEAARKAEVASGTIPAPNFTLPDLAGKDVSLSDFRGKWVVLDFWGSWCGWCIKGFPALKEAYKKYGDKIVVIGIGCNEPEADWRAGVKQHQIPWLNVYNGNDKSLYEAYNVEGFPTKAIINPDGYLVDLTTGEDPSFYDRLAEFVK